MIRSLRPFEIVGRGGGDEFLAIIRNVNEETLKDLCAGQCHGWLRLLFAAAT